MKRLGFDEIEEVWNAVFDVMNARHVAPRRRDYLGALLRRLHVLSDPDVVGL
jgi:hypothetical protein